MSSPQAGGVAMNADKLELAPLKKENNATHIDDDDENPIQSVQLNKDIFTLFFLMMYNKHKYNKQIYKMTKIKTFVWCLGVILTYSIQLFCLSVLSIAYSKQFTAGYAGSEKWIAYEAPTHFLCGIAAFFVLYTYSLGAIRPFVFLYSSVLNCPGGKLPKFCFYYGIIVAISNIALILGTWFVSIVVIFAGLYTKTENAADVLLAAVSNVFILEIDDYICSMFEPAVASKFNWEIKVKYQQFSKSSHYFFLWAAILFVLIVIVFSGTAGDFYSNMSQEWVKDSADYSLAILALSYILMFAVCGCLVIVSLANDKWQKRLIDFLWILLCIGQGPFLQNFFYYDSNLQYLVTSESKTVICGILSWIVIVGSVALLLLYFVIICFKKYGETNKKCIYMIINVLFWAIQAISIISAIVWRTMGYEFSEPWHVILMAAAAIFFKYYCQDVVRKTC